MGEEKTEGIKIFTVGNILTMSRLALLPVIIAGIALGNGWLAVAGMGAALVTDLLDGRISRRMGTASEFGGNLDSTIDFVLLHGVFIAFYAAGRIRTEQFMVIYAVMLATLALNLLGSSAGKGQGVVKTRFGKPTGALEYTYLLFLVVMMVMKSSPALAVVNWVIFGAIGFFGLIYIVECITRLRKLV
jgi:phosphatidylglycerophosphate synthase